VTITPPVALDVDAVLLDIEGTTSSIRFVTDVLFPFARKHVRAYLDAHFERPETAEAIDLMARDLGHADRTAWFASVGVAANDRGGANDRSAAIDRVVAETERLMDGDVKATGLKALQGLIWRGGFESGELQAHVYDEVPDALRRWNRRGLDVRIYSSGSVEAQRLFFGHTIVGDLLNLFRGHYDTQIGSKRDAASYRKIAAEFGLAPERILFVTDLGAEAIAAAEAGMRTAISLRPDNAPVDDAVPGHRIRSFDALILPDRTRGESRR